MTDIVAALKQDLLAYIDSGVSEDDYSYTVQVSHCNILKWFDALDRLSAQQREPVVRVKPLTWSKEPPYHIARMRIGFYSVEYIESDDGGYFDLRGNFGRSGYRTLAEAKAAAQADYEQRIMAAIEIAPQSDRQPLPGQKQISETGKELPENAEQPMNNADVSVGELAGFFATEFPPLMTMSTQIEVARALLARYRIERLDRLASSGRR